MSKLNKIFCALAILSSFALLSGTVLAEPERESDGVYACETAQEESNNLLSEDEDGQVIIGEGNDDFPSAYIEMPEGPCPDTVYPDEIMISPPYDPDSGELPPASGEPREMFADYDKGNGDIEDIMEYWETNGYPEYVSFICDQGVATYDVATQTETVYHLWEIGIADISEEKKDEIKALVSSEQHLFFTPCTYNLEERRGVKEKIEREYPLAEVSLSKYGEEIEVVISGYPEDELEGIEADILSSFDGESGIIRILKSVPTIGIPEIGVSTAPAVSEGVPETAPEIGVNPADTEAPAVDSSLDSIGTEEEAFGSGSEILPEQTAISSAADNIYGAEDAPLDTPPINDNLPDIDADKKADIEKANNPEVSGAISEIGAVAAMINNESQRSGEESLWIWICAVAAAAAAITAAVILGRKRMRTVSLADGGEVSEGGKTTKAEVVKAVAESEAEPSEKVFGEIIERINKEEK